MCLARLFVRLRIEMAKANSEADRTTIWTASILIQTSSNFSHPNANIENSVPEHVHIHTTTKYRVYRKNAYRRVKLNTTIRILDENARG